VHIITKQHKKIRFWKNICYCPNISRSFDKNQALSWLSADEIFSLE